MARRVICLWVLISIPILGYAQTRQDSSDWWSLVRREEVPGEILQVKGTSKPLDEKNFEIACVRIGENQFKDAAIKFGRSDEVSRGDGASGRQQVCYQSIGHSPSIHLIFEFGEVESVTYLFKGDKAWNGSATCAKSRLISDSLSTRSGLKLGLTRPEVEAILGPPDAAGKGRIVYSREIRRRTTKKEFEQMRREYPENLTDKQAHDKFDFIEEDSDIEIHFKDSRVVYLAVSEDDG